MIFRVYLNIKKTGNEARTARPRAFCPDRFHRAETNQNQLQIPPQSHFAGRSFAEPQQQAEFNHDHISNSDQLQRQSPAKRERQFQTKQKHNRKLPQNR